MLARFHGSGLDRRNQCLASGGPCMLPADAGRAAQRAPSVGAGAALLAAALWVYRDAFTAGLTNWTMTAS